MTNLRVVIKVGSNVLTNEHNELDESVIASLVQQISALKKEGVSVVLVSSGAVAAGKSLYQLKNVSDETVQRQVYSSIGQVKLMNLYHRLFSEQGLICSQVLASKEDFMGGEQYKNMKNCFNGLLLDSIIPIVNENDVVSLDELMFTDNDELAGLTAFLIKADHLIILTNVDGLYDGDPRLKTSKVISSVLPKDDLTHLIQTAKSSSGRGGMESKYNIAKKAALKGITTTIANGKKEDIALKIVKQENYLGTSFLPA